VADVADVATKRLFVFTASDADARDHIEKSIARPIDPHLCATHFEKALLDVVRAESGDGQFYAWGATPGAGNQRTWGALQPGDFVLAYQAGVYTFTTRVISKHRNEAFAKALWGTRPDGETWELVYFLTRPVPIRVPIQELAAFLPGRYFGFIRVDDERTNRILAQYGSVERFIAERITERKSAGYVLIRSNVGSEWRDEEGKSYHFGTTVPNYKSIVPGTEFILDRRFPDGKKIIAKGRIGNVTPEPSEGSSRTFRAQFAPYEPIDPPTVVTPPMEEALRALPGYNPQHSIRVLTKEVFERLTKPAAWIFQANPEIYDVRAAIHTLPEIMWLALQHKDEILPGNRVYLWESGPTGGIVGVAEVLDPVSAREEPTREAPFVRDSQKLSGPQPRVNLRMRRIVDPILPRGKIQAHPKLANLSILRQAQGTNFPVTSEEDEVLSGMLGGPPVDIERILAKLHNEGFVFPESLVKNYLLSIRTKPFVLLTGMSGGGKTALTRLIAAALDEPHCVIAVKPNWTDSHDLLGFYNPITGQYVREQTLTFILRAVSEYAARGDQARQYHLCLDEMNLSRVEYYFAEILSAMELPDRAVYLHSAPEIDGIPGTLVLPPNLVVVGTVNIDETVQPFSDKVKDRANTIVVPIDMAAYVGLLRTGVPPQGNAIKQKAFTYAQTDEGKRALDMLVRVHQLLVPQQMHFGYRIVDEILAYMAENAAMHFLPFQEAMDLQVDQKILPKIKGRGDAFEKLLACTGGHCEHCLHCLFTGADFPHSAERVVRMAALLRETGYTAYEATY
jgi:energy-coupling factor transporter ATP-binding protein EcfA2